MLTLGLLTWGAHGTPTPQGPLQALFLPIYHQTFLFFSLGFCGFHHLYNVALCLTQIHTG